MASGTDQHSPDPSAWQQLGVALQSLWRGTYRCEPRLWLPGALGTSLNKSHGMGLRVCASVSTKVLRGEKGSSSAGAHGG